MPTYEYVCRSCGHAFEVVRSIHDEALTVCPDCGGELRKVFAPPAIAFKGSGFYTTDHRRSSSKGTPAAKDGGGSSERTGTDGAKKDGDAKGGSSGSDAKGGSSGSDAKGGSTSSKEGSAT